MACELYKHTGFVVSTSINLLVDKYTFISHQTKYSHFDWTTAVTWDTDIFSNYAEDNVL